jgi:hypothetical protein
MKKIAIGLLLSIGWCLGSLIGRALEEILFSRLHKSDWYNKAAGKQTNNKNNTTDTNAIKAKIGFI